MELFVPEKLIGIRKQIQEAALRKKQVSYEPGEELEKLLNRLYDADDSMVKAAAVSISDKQADMLAGYLPYNYYGRDENRLFSVMKHRMDEHTSRVLYSQWQESFNNPECNRFLKELSASDPCFRSMLESCGIAPDAFADVLDSPNIPLGFDEELVGKHFEDGADFNNKLKSRGVCEQSYLDIECKRALLAFCGRADYLSCSQENLLDIIKGYDLYMLKKFLYNFLRKMSLSELQAYPEIAAYMRNTVGHRKSASFQEFFADAQPSDVQQFIDWINIFKLNAYFDNDERSRFWKQYRFLNVIRYPASDTLVLEFESYVAVEFLGDDKSTIYICDKEVFRKSFYEQLNLLDNNDIRIYFRLHKELCLEYRNHTGRWQAHLDGLITKKQIAEKVRI